MGNDARHCPDTLLIDSNSPNSQPFVLRMKAIIRKV